MQPKILAVLKCVIIAMAFGTIECPAASLVGAALTSGGALQSGGTSLVLGQPLSGQLAGPSGSPLLSCGFIYLMPPCPGDFNGDTIVNTFDLARFLSHFGQSVSQSPDAAPADFNIDGIVNTIDLADFLGHFGQVCP